MATDKLINQTQGDDIIDALSDIATNVSNITYGPQTSADKVVSMIGYAEAAEAASINPGDTLNQAIGKLEKKADDNATAVADKIDKVTNPTTGAIATLTATGEVADSEVTIAKNATGVTDDDTKVPTSKAVKTYVDSTATGISRYIGTITAASQLSTSAKKGDFYVVKTAWSGVHAGDEIIAEKDNPSQTIDGTNWSLLHNEADTDTKYTFATGDDNGTFKVTPSDTGTAQSVPIKGLGNAAYKGVADTVSTSTDLVTSNAVNTKLGDYVPNSDFVVAENNIQYLINHGMKNQLKLTGDVWNPNTLFVYWDYTNGTVRVVGSSATTSTVFIYLGSWTAPEDNVYRLYANGLACTANIRIYDDVSWTTYAATSSESNEVTWTRGTTRPLYLRIASGVVVGDITVTPMICQKSVFDADSSFVPYAASNYDLTHQLMEINQLVRDTQPIYGYRIAKNNLDPDTRVEYLFDAVGMTPAYMNFSTGQFNYGSWGDIWFIKNNKPVALNFDGTEAFELNPTNYWQKSDGTTAIDIEDDTLNYNYMSRIPTVYVKRWEDSQYNYVAFTQYPQGGFTAYAHQGASGKINENMYLPMFKGFKDSNGKLRSLAGKTPWNTTGGIGYELDAAKAIATTNNGWQIWDFAKHELISDLLTLISKHTSSRWKFGKGVIKTASSAAGFCKGGYEYDGTTKATCAQFWGTDEGTGNTPSTEDGSHHVRVFHIEDLWGNRWDRCLGLHLINGIYKVKMFAPYYATAPTGSGALLPDETYETLSLTPPSVNYLQNQSTGFYGNIPISTSGDKNKGYCSYFWQSSGADRLLLFGGSCGSGFNCSARCLHLGNTSVDSGWYIGASPCFNHL